MRLSFLLHLRTCENFTEKRKKGASNHSINKKDKKVTKTQG